MTKIFRSWDRRRPAYNQMHLGVSVKTNCSPRKNTISKIVSYAHPREYSTVYKGPGRREIIRETRDIERKKERKIVYFPNNSGTFLMLMIFRAIQQTNIGLSSYCNNLSTGQAFSYTVLKFRVAEEPN